MFRRKEMIKFEEELVNKWNHKIIYAPNGFGKTTNANKLNNYFSNKGNRSLIFTRKQIEDLVKTYNNKIFFGETAINAEENISIKEKYKNNDESKKYFKDNYGSKAISALKKNSFFIVKSNIKSFDDFEDVTKVSFDGKDVFSENDAIIIDKKLNYKLYVQIEELINNKDKIKKGRTYKRLELVDESFFASFERLKNQALNSDKLNCPMCGKKFSSKDKLIEAIEKKKNKYRLIENNNLYEMLIDAVSKISNLYYDDTIIHDLIYDFDEEFLKKIKGMMKLILNYHNLCDKAFQSMSKYFGDIKIDGEKTIKELKKKYDDNRKKIDSEKNNITNINHFTSYIINELHNIISIDNNVEFKPIPNKLEVTITNITEKQVISLYDVLSESEIKRFSLVVLRALIRYGKYDSLILDDPIDSYDDYYLLIACDYVKKIVKEVKLKNWYVLTNNFNALLNISSVIKCDSIIYYYNPDDIFTNNNFIISSFDATYKEIDTVSKSELQLLHQYLKGRLGADDELSYVSLIVTLRNFKTLILNNYDRVFVKKGRKTGTPPQFYIDENYMPDVKKYIEHYYMHYDEKNDAITGINSNSIEVKRIVDLYDRVCKANNTIMTRYSGDNGSLCSMRENVAKRPFALLTGSKIINLIFVKICIVSYLKYEFEKQLIIKLKNVFGFSPTELDDICNEKSLGKKINKASEISILSSRGADTYIEEYSKVYDSNKLLFNLFDHALEQMFPPYIATNVKDIKKFRLEMEELDSKF